MMHIRITQLEIAMKIFAIQISTAVAGLGVYQAAQWIDGGFGLNPFIALPLATFCVLAPYFIDKVILARASTRRYRR